MDNFYKKGNFSSNSKATTLESLVSLLVTTCYSRINLQSFDKLDLLREKFKELLSMEEKKHLGEKQKYDNFRNVVDLFFDYIEDDNVIEQIKNGKITKQNLENRFLSNVMNSSKRKLNMQDLYRSDLIASVSHDSNLKNVKMLFKENGQEYSFIDSQGRHFILKDIGNIPYEEWGGIKSDLPIYQLQKEQDNGKFSKYLICTRIIIPEMDNPKYRNAILEVLFSDDNINKSNAGIYIGQILKRAKSNPRDLPHTERQTTNEYTYRIDDEYVLEYDATELTAVIEAIKQITNNNRDSKKNNSTKSGIISDEFDEQDGR